MLDPRDSTSPSPVHELNYEPPQPHPGHRALWIILGGFFLAFGAGWFVFGLLLMMGLRDDHAGPMGVGVGCVIFGCSFLIIPFLKRRP